MQIAFALERQSDGKMERIVAAELLMKNGEMLAMCIVSRIDGLHTQIETQDEIIEIHPQAQSVCHSYLLVELVQLELSAGLFVI